MIQVRVRGSAACLCTVPALLYLQELIAARQNGASWMRAMLAQSGDLTDLMRMQAALFRSSVGRGAGSVLQSRSDVRNDRRVEPHLHSLPNARGEKLAA